LQARPVVRHACAQLTEVALRLTMVGLGELARQIDFA
jgi:hypothetical protein